MAVIDRERCGSGDSARRREAAERAEVVKACWRREREGRSLSDGDEWTAEGVERRWLTASRAESARRVRRGESQSHKVWLLIE